MSSSSRDIVVTGLGATTPLGGDVTSTWEAMLAGRSGVKSIDDEEHEWVRRFDLPVRIAAPLAVSPLEVIPRVQARRLDRCEQVALVAALRFPGAPYPPQVRRAAIAALTSSLSTC